MMMNSLTIIPKLSIQTEMDLEIIRRFPTNEFEWFDMDNDTYEDNIDWFPYDSSEWEDSDMDE